MFKKLKNKKGFTLVELIVVLVILAILAALLVPALTGYIDKANQEKVIAECRSVVMAAQTTASEYYGLNKSLESTEQDNINTALAQIQTLAEVPTKDGAPTWHYQITLDEVNGEKNVVKSVMFDDGTSVVTYTKSDTGEGTYSKVTKTADGTADGTGKVLTTKLNGVPATTTPATPSNPT